MSVCLLLRQLSDMKDKWVKIEAWIQLNNKTTKLYYVEKHKFLFVCFQQLNDIYRERGGVRPK